MSGCRYNITIRTVFRNQVAIFLLALCIFNDVEAAPIPQISDLIRLRPHVFYTIARIDDKLEFVCDRRQNTILWVLPNNVLLELNQTSNENIEFEFQEMDIIVTPHSLRIPKVESGMEGRYSCLLDNGEQFHFYLLQVSPRLNFTKAIALSVTVSIGFALICTTVLLLDKFCSRPGAVVRPATTTIFRMEAVDEDANPILSQD